MNYRRIYAIVYRELAEIMTDWRMVVPLLTLTFVVPSLAVLTVLLVTVFLHDTNWALSLLPLTLLLCGFLPAGFAMGNASESFVGEQERKTLESLLSTAVTDAEIYLGKVTAAVLLPLTSSLLAIATFTGLFVLSVPAPLVAQLHPAMIAAIVLLVTLKAIVLVAGAVLISIHATSVRGANLLSAFALVPVGAMVNVDAYLLVAHRLDLLLPIAVSFAITAVLLLWAGLSTFKRETVLAREQTSVRIPWLARPVK